MEVQTTDTGCVVIEFKPEEIVFPEVTPEAEQPINETLHYSQREIPEVMQNGQLLYEHFKKSGVLRISVVGYDLDSKSFKKFKTVCIFKNTFQDREDIKSLTFLMDVLGAWRAKLKESLR